MLRKGGLEVSRNDNDIVRKLLLKHNPQLLDSAVGPEDGGRTQRYAHQQEELLEESHTEADLSEEAACEAYIQERRRRLAEKLSGLRKKQIVAEGEAAIQRLTLREKQIEQQVAGAAGANSFRIVADTVPLGATRMELVERRLPELVSARDAANLEISRAINDPVFGIINKRKIQHAEEVLKTKRHRETAEYKKAMKAFAKQIKDP